MATHNLTGTINCGVAGSWNAYWRNYYTNSYSSSHKVVGKLSNENVMYACNITFNKTELASLRSKTKTSMSITVSGNGYLYASGNEIYWPLRYKATEYTTTNSATPDSTRDPWKSSNANSTADSYSNMFFLTSQTSSPQSGNFTKTYDISSLSVPVYGFVMGPANSSYTRQLTLSSFSLKVVIPDYVVSYNKGDYGTGTDTSETVEAKDSTTLPGAIFTRTGYTQTGWSTNSNGSTKNYNLNASYTVNAAVTLYPYWEIDTYTVTYNPGQYGSGTIAADTKTYGIDLQLSSSTYSRADYTQTGWSTVDGGSKDYNLGGLYTTDADIILYPYWNRNQFLITYDAVGGTGAPATQYKTPGVDIQLSSTIPTKTGFTFLGWDDSSAATTVDYHPGDTYTTDANLDLYAVWKTAGLWVMGSNLQLKAVPIYVMKQGGLVECQIYIMDSNGHLKRV